ncbi:MAG: penicillin-binding protein 1C [Nitrospina sp.]|nr:penicillin-binding protein 1C [Nitrospina sp.]
MLEEAKEVYKGEFVESKKNGYGTLIVSDQFKKPLRWFPDIKGERHLWISIDKIAGTTKKAFIAAEDQRFFSHIGIDPISMVRALKENMIQGKIVLGASTITQQMIRIAYPRNRTYSKKFIEVLRSLRAEGHLSKEAILEVYLNRVPMGNNLTGVEAASRIYFKKPSSSLNLHENALLAALPKAPGTLNPYGHNKKKLKVRRNWVLKRMYALGFISLKEKLRAEKQPVLVSEKVFPFDAPHFVEIIDKNKISGNTTTTIDLMLQKRVEQILGSHRKRLKKQKALQGSVVVIENKTSNVLALVGSMEHSKTNLGFNNGAISKRSAGSTLKPFLYAKALDEGHSPSDTLEDLKRSYVSPKGIYRPVNFNRTSYGPVSMREALGNSLNQSAIYLINQIGYENFFKTVSLLGLNNYKEHDADHYGLGLVIGNLEVKLIQLAAAYATLARGGEFMSPRFLKNEPKPSPNRIFSPESSYIITDILSDPSARVLTFGDFFNQKLPFKVALKTGTSTHYRDSWIIGYTLEYTIAIWIGNFDGSSTSGLSGAKGGGPIFIDILNELYPDRFAARFKKPESVIRKTVCSYSGLVPNSSCPHTKEELFIREFEPQEKCQYHSKDKKFHNLPSQYTDWVYKRFKNGGAGKYRLAGFSNNLKNIFNGSNSLEDPSKSSKVGIKITSPLTKEVFLLDPGKTSYEIHLSALGNAPTQKVSWYVNGLEIASTSLPHHTTVALMKGAHEITAIGPNNQGHSIVISIE